MGIVNDTQFKEANEMFHAMLMKLKQAGKGSVLCYTKDPISKEDFENQILVSVRCRHTRSNMIGLA